jgi:hypothetical protein
MMDTLALQHPGVLVAIAAVIGATLIVLAAIVTVHLRSVRRTELEAALKQDMLNRGMSVDEIERVIRVSELAAPPAPHAEKAETISDNEYYLVEKLVDEGKSAEEIERVIKACRNTCVTAPREVEAPH